MPTKKATKKSAKKSSYLKSNKLVYGVVSLAVIAILITVVPATATYATDQIRLQRINNVYATLALGDDYILQRSNVFGDKRVYDWDKSRSYSSSKEYVHAKSVDSTTAELRKKIEAAGFSYYSTPYPGSAYQMIIFKSDDGKYIRLTVSSKPRDDLIQNKALMEQKLSDGELDTMDINAGPSNVTVKVNLDDNNE